MRVYCACYLVLVLGDRKGGRGGRRAVIGFGMALENVFKKIMGGEGRTDRHQYLNFALVFAPEMPTAASVTALSYTKKPDVVHIRGLDRKGQECAFFIAGTGHISDTDFWRPQKQKQKQKKAKETQMKAHTRHLSPDY